MVSTQIFKKEKKITPVLCTTFLYMLTKRSIAPSLKTNKQKHETWHLKPQYLYYIWYTYVYHIHIWYIYLYYVYRKVKHICVYLISKDGRWGRKSFPTKKHMKTQSSTLLSKSKVKGKLAIVSSLSKYCNTHKRHQKVLCIVFKNIIYTEQM